MFGVVGMEVPVLMVIAEYLHAKRGDLVYRIAGRTGDFALLLFALLAAVFKKPA